MGDVIQIEKTNENFRLIYDVKGRFTIHRITHQEAKYKLCRVKAVKTGPKNVPYLYTSDGRTIRYPDPVIKVNDSIRVDINTGKIMDFIKFDSGNLCMVTGGRNTGRVGTIMHRERHPGSFDIVHVKDANDHTFATRLDTFLSLGKGPNHTFPCLRVLVLSCRLLRKETKDYNKKSNTKFIILM